MKHTYTEKTFALVHQSPICSSHEIDWLLLQTIKILPVIWLAQQIFTCSKSTIETLEKGVKYLQC